MKVIDIVNDNEIFERITNLGCINCRKNNNTILKNKTITELGEPFNKLLHPISFHNQLIPIPTVYVTNDLSF